MEGNEAKGPGLLSFAGALLLLVVLVLMARAAYLWYTTPVRHQDYWKVPDRQPVPQELREARQTEAAIQEQDKRWEAEEAALKALIDSQRPGELDLAKDMATTDAARAYVEKLLRLGEETVASFVRLHATGEKLDGLLSNAPATYRAMAALARRYGEEERWRDIKDDYFTTADIWEGKAKSAARHQHEVREHLNNELLAYFKAKNVFLERLLTMLKNGLSADDLRETAKFRANLQQLVTKYESLRAMLRTWRARVQDEPSAPPGPKPEKREAAAPTEAAAPAPKVRRVTWSNQTLYSPPEPSASSYWAQVREQEAAWQNKMRHLLATVDDNSGSVLRHLAAIERDMQSAQETARTFVDLLRRAPRRAPLPACDVTEQQIRWAMDEPELGASILERTVEDELSLIAELLPKLHQLNGWLPGVCKDLRDPDSPNRPFRRLALEWEEFLRGKLHATLPKIFGEPEEGIPPNSHKPVLVGDTADPDARPVADSPAPPLPTPAPEASRDWVIRPAVAPNPPTPFRPRVREQAIAAAYRAPLPPPAARAAPSPATSNSIPYWLNSMPGPRRSSRPQQ